MFKTEHIECTKCKETTINELRKLDKKLYYLGLKMIDENVSFNESKINYINKNWDLIKQLETEIHEIKNNHKIYYCEDHKPKLVP